MITWLAWQAYEHNYEWGDLVAILAGTLVATAWTTAIVAGMLKPVETASRALELYGADRTVVPLPDCGPDLVGRLVRGVETSMRGAEAMIGRLEDAAYTDPLTGLANRRAFLERARALVESGQDVTVALLDIDHFKQVNDRFGHETGDRVLCAVAGLLREGVRRTDFVARWGGEEFAILFLGASEEETCGIVERIRFSVERARILTLDDRPVTVSGGLSSVEAQERTIDAATRRADDLLYVAKRNGRNRVALALAA